MAIPSFAPAGQQSYTTFTVDSLDRLRISPMLNGTLASTAYPAANLAIYIPFWLERPVTVFETWVESGTLTTSNATEIGVYDVTGSRLFTTATTVAVASDVVNSSGMTDYVLDRGHYYLAFACDGTRNFLVSTIAATIFESYGVLEQTGLTGANLPSSMTGVAYTRAYMPMFGLNLRADAL